MDTRGQHGNQVGQKDEYGTPIQQTDAYGKPLSTHEAGSDTTGAGYGTTTGAGGGQTRHPEKEHHGGGILHGLGGTNSSSEKLPGGRKTDENGQQGYGHGQDTTGTGYGGTTTTTGATGHNDSEKKGFMEKIKERIPGGDKTGEHGQQGYGHGQATTGTGTGYGGTTPTTRATGHYDPEKKGFVEKVKERIPGGDKTGEHGQPGHGQATPGTGTGYGGTPMTTRGATGHNDPEKKGFVEKIKERIPGGDKTGEHGQQGHGHGQATTGTGTGTGYGGTTTTGATGHNDPEKRGFVEKIKERIPGGDKTGEQGQHGHGHGQATTGTGYGGTTTTGATGHNDPEKRGFVEKIKERIPGGDKTGEHGQQGHGHGQATTGTGTGYGGTTTTGATGHNDPEKRGFVEKVKEKIPGGDKTGAHGQQGYEHGQATTGAGHGGTTTTTGAVNDPEKKGFMEKIKEKLPGGRN